jgi:predicted aspartyl protease
MITGRFVFDRPTIDCHITIKSLNIDGVVPFLIDTGADTSLLLPVDSVRFNIPFDQLTNSRIAYGLGGPAKVFYMPATLIVADKKTAYGYRFALDIAEPSEDLDDMPASLLGRDILQYWKLTIEFPEHKINFEVQTCDEEFQL